MDKKPYLYKMFKNTPLQKCLEVQKYKKTHTHVLIKKFKIFNNVCRKRWMTKNRQSSVKEKNLCYQPALTY